MASSCGIPNFGTQYVGFLQKVCKPEAQSTLASVIGRPPVCPTACLKSLDEQAEAPAQAEAQAETPAQAEALAPADDDPPVVEKRTIWKRRNHPYAAPARRGRRRIRAAGGRLPAFGSLTRRREASTDPG